MIDIETIGMAGFNREISKLSKKLDNPKKFFEETKIRLRQEINDHFNKEEGPKGRWKPLSPVTIKRKGSSGILKDDGNLKDRLIASAKSTNKYAVIGTDVKYAPTHQFGARKGEYGSDNSGRPIPWGDVPARPFLWMSSKGGDKLMKLMHNYIDGVLN